MISSYVTSEIQEFNVILSFARKWRKDLNALSIEKSFKIVKYYIKGSHQNVVAFHSYAILVSA